MKLSVYAVLVKFLMFPDGIEYQRNQASNTRNPYPDFQGRGNLFVIFSPLTTAH